MSGDTTLKNAAETIRRLNVGRATVPAGGPTDRVWCDLIASRLSVGVLDFGAAS